MNTAKERIVDHVSIPRHPFPSHVRRVIMEVQFTIALGEMQDASSGKSLISSYKNKRKERSGNRQARLDPGSIRAGEAS